MNERALGEAMARAGGLYEAVHFLVAPASPLDMPGERRREQFVGRFGEHVLDDLVKLGYVQVGRPALVPVYVTAHYAQFRNCDESDARRSAPPNRVQYDSIVSLTWRAWLYVGRELPDPSWCSEHE